MQYIIICSELITVDIDGQSRTWYSISSFVCTAGCKVGWQLAPLPHSKTVPGSILEYVWVLFKYAGFLPLPQNIPVRLIADSEIDPGK